MAEIQNSQPDLGLQQNGGKKRRWISGPIQPEAMPSKETVAHAVSFGFADTMFNSRERLIGDLNRMADLPCLRSEE